MAYEPTLPTVLDVIDNVLGSAPKAERVARLSLSELDGLRDRLSELWEAQHADPVVGGAYLVGDWTPAFWSEPQMRTALANSLMYYPRLLVLDPLADFFGDRSVIPEMHTIRYRRPDGQYNVVSSGPRIWTSHGIFDSLRDSPAVAATKVARILRNLYELEPLIRSGVLVVRSQWPTLRDRRQHIATSVRHDIQSDAMQRLARLPRPGGEALAVWDNLRGFQISMNGPVHAADARWKTEPEFYFLAKTLAVADAAGSQYVPSTESDLELLRAKVNNCLPHRHPGELLQEVARVVLPTVDVPIKRAIEMRESSENFADWRSGLDQLRRSSSADDPDELRERVEDDLRPRIHAVEREVARTSLSTSARDEFSDLVISAMIGSAAALASGDGLTGVGAGFGTGVAQWVRRAYMRERPSGADAVLATLIRKA